MPDHEYLPPSAASAVAARPRLHAGSYRRILPVSVERLYENALDWRRLNHVHRASIRSLVGEDAGPRWWRARLGWLNGLESLVEMVLERRLRRWIVRFLGGAGAGTEIWTQVCPLAAHRLEVVVDLFLPDSVAAAAEPAGRPWADRLALWYDRDVAMMVERQRQLDVRLDGAGSGTAVRHFGTRAALKLPLTFELAGRWFVLAEIAAAGPPGRELVAYPARCPHQLGPLYAGPLNDGVVTCPWHGYRFDVRTGAARSGQSCRLTQLPRIETDADGGVRAVAVH